MSYNISIVNSKHQFKISPDETILEAALNNGVRFPYSCKQGVCKACKGKLIHGKIEYTEPPSVLTEQESNEGYELFCRARAKSDLEIEINLLPDLNQSLIKQVPCRVEQLEQLADDVMYVLLKLPDKQQLNYFPGQYIDIVMKNGKKRSFSIANRPNDDPYIQLHIRHIPGGEFTEYLFKHSQEKDIWRIEGPHGMFYLQEESENPIILMAGGTGFAPIKAIIESLVNIRSQRSIYLYWGARKEGDLYLSELAEKWAQSYRNIHYIPVLSDAEDEWQGRTGFVHQAIVDDYDDLSGFDIYTCGPPAMIEAGREAFLKLGMDESHYYFDSFDFAKD